MSDVSVNSDAKSGKLVIGLTVGSALMLLSAGSIYGSFRSDVEMLKEQMKLRATSGETQQGFNEVTRRLDRMESSMSAITNILLTPSTRPR